MLAGPYRRLDRCRPCGDSCPAGVFRSPISAFAAIYIGLFAYIVIEIIYGELS